MNAAPWSFATKTVEVASSTEVVRHQGADLPWPAATVVFAERRDRLAHYTYALLRALEFACAWLVSTTDVDHKVALGRFIGYVGEDIARLDRRLQSLLPASANLVAPASCEHAFESGAGLSDSAGQAAFLADLVLAMATDAAAFEHETDPVADEPTVIALGELIPNLERAARALGTATSPARHDGTARSGVGSVCYTGRETLPHIADRPGRPSNWTFDPEPAFRQTRMQVLLERGDALKRWLHEIGINIEINAMEVCAHNVVGFRTMPLQFKLDMARQIWDETRHAMLMRERLAALGGAFGDYPYNDKVWAKYVRGTDLAERLAIEQIFQEGNALEANVPMARAFQRAGASDLAEVLDYINADEMRHALFGNRWLKYLTDGSIDAYIDVLRRVARKLELPLRARGAVDPDLRRLADFPEPFIDLLAAGDVHAAAQ